MSNTNKSERVVIEIVSRGDTRKVSVLKKYGQLKTLAAVIRAMSKDGWTKGKIAKDLGIRYQHVRNTLETVGQDASLLK